MRPSVLRGKGFDCQTMTCDGIEKSSNIQMRKFKPSIIMPQLHFYVPDLVAEQIKRRAAQAGQPVSRYVAELVMRDEGQGWPAGYFENVTAPSSHESIPYESAGPPEERLPLK